MIDSRTHYPKVSITSKGHISYLLISSRNKNCRQIKLMFYSVLLFFLVFFCIPLGEGFSQQPANNLSEEESKASTNRGFHLTKEEKDWLKQNHVIRARVGKAPPLHFFDENNQGVSVDYLNLIAKNTGLKVEYINDIPWSDALSNIKNHRVIDIILTAKNIEERRDFMLFTDDYLFMPWVIFTRTKSDFVGSIDDLSGKTVSVEKNYVMHKKLVSEFPSIKLLPKETTLEALQAVASGEADAYIGNLTISTYIIQKYNLTNLKIASPTPFDNHNQAFAVRNDWPELVSIINKVLDTVTPQENAEIRNKWFSLKYEYGISKADVLKWIVVIIGFCGIIMIFFAFWNRKLKAEINERKQTEEALRESEKKYRNFLGNLNAGVVAHAPDTSILYCNQKALQLLGLTMEQALGKTAVGLHWKFLNKDQTDMLSDDFPINLALKAETELVNYVVGIAHPDQKHVTWVSCNSLSVINHKGNLEHILISFFDITKLKKAEEEKEDLQVQLHHAQKMEAIGTLAGGIAHDFNNILAIILGNADWLLMTFLIGIPQVSP